ncbi:hypothetical protein SDC9_13968 [bioreactor metagenome]|uniref:Stage II sporulation protein P n=1 Tax=bioreactor metagenome TaxID=1076179 RepID=A0A644TP97_9ZZZZ|nr:stage II sporulation protein P [Negativicutes bacterium]
MLRVLISLLILVLMTQQSPQAFSAFIYDGAEQVGYVTILDEQDNIVMQTGLNIQPGDEYIGETNHVYQIMYVENNIAKARYVRNDISQEAEPEALPAQASQGAVRTSQAPANQATKVAIYHTHTDESYIPSDGKSTTPGKGSIIDVGSTFSDQLNKLGYTTIHSKTIHEPHDANAYQRSRRTFTKLLAQQPAALFDIHRDSAPLQTYKATINGQDTTKILLVVGRQNQNHNTTLNYARQLKREADRKYKGLIRGIFIAHGNYNQDLSPRAMLVEVGTQYNTREAAERGITLFADIIPSIIAPQKNGARAQSEAPDNDQAPNPQYSPNQAATTTPPKSDNSLLADIVFLIGAVIAGAVFYLYLSTGSWEEAKDKLRKLRKSEFTNFFGPHKKRK